MIIEVTLQMAEIGGDDHLFTDDDRIVKLFVGFKDSNQIFRQLWIRSRNKGTGYEQSEMCREGFAMGQSMDYNSKKSRKYTHTLYDNAYHYNQNVCGIFINEIDLKDNLPHSYPIELIIPFDDLAALQAFSFFPNTIIGDIELNFYCGSQGLVWCPVDPRTVLDIKVELEALPIEEHIWDDYVINITHQFGQINNPLRVVNRIAVGEDKHIGITTASIGGMERSFFDLHVL
jgi:hypothetical protein